MVINPRNDPGYCEKFDLDGLEELMQMAFNDVAIEEGCNVKGKHIPDGTYSDFDCIVWEAMKRWIRDGMALEKSLNK